MAGWTVAMKAFYLLSFVIPRVIMRTRFNSLDEVVGRCDFGKEIRERKDEGESNVWLVERLWLGSDNELRVGLFEGYELVFHWGGYAFRYKVYMRAW
ncbi:unnamed protein product [Dovyalis caffra]|uniref:Uncharacterized protein n=1 Tax=Dovyalis caffra TaxID=77055 RepID=A0AAV1R5M4_9ROSI|nr:unnamed protein product [Dovyalis caffra]